MKELLSKVESAIAAEADLILIVLDRPLSTRSAISGSVAKRKREVTLGAMLLVLLC